MLEKMPEIPIFWQSRIVRKVNKRSMIRSRNINKVRDLIFA